MSIRVRPADLASDQNTLIDALAEHLNPKYDDARFRWLYSNNVHGSARVWLVLDPSQVVCGVAAAFPRRFSSGNQKVNGWVLGDFCLNRQYRSLGPALQLQRACLKPVEKSERAFCYDFPSASMVAVYKRLGVGVTGRMLRLARPLRVDRKVKQVVHNRVAQRVAVSVGNTLLSVVSRRAKLDGSLETNHQQGPCGEEFTRLAQEQRGKFSFCLERSAAYLNWRYLKNPLAEHEIITARRGGCLVGYSVWTQSGEDASIVDLFGEPDVGIVKTLVDEVITRARERGVVTLSVSVNESHPWRSAFGEMGFRERESFPVVIVPSKNFNHKIDSQLKGWYLMQGDRDS